MPTILPPQSARVWELPAGSRLRITDPHGGQAGDLVLFASADHRTRFSQSRTRVENHSIRPGVGAELWSGGPAPAVLAHVTSLAPTARLDLLYTPCCRWALAKRFNLAQDGCWELLGEALRPHGIAPADLPDPLNFFFGVDVDPSGTLAIVPGGSHPGDHVEITARRDLLAAVSSCPAPRRDGRAAAELLVEINT